MGNMKASTKIRKDFEKNASDAVKAAAKRNEQQRKNNAPVKDKNKSTSRTSAPQTSAAERYFNDALSYEKEREERRIREQQEARTRALREIRDASHQYARETGQLTGWRNRNMDSQIARDVNRNKPVVTGETAYTQFADRRDAYNNRINELNKQIAEARTMIGAGPEAVMDWRKLQIERDELKSERDQFIAANRSNTTRQQAIERMTPEEMQRQYEVNKAMYERPLKTIRDFENAPNYTIHSEDEVLAYGQAQDETKRIRQEQNYLENRLAYYNMAPEQQENMLRYAREAAANADSLETGTFAKQTASKAVETDKLKKQIMADTGMDEETFQHAYDTASRLVNQERAENLKQQVKQMTAPELAVQNVLTVANNFFKPGDLPEIVNAAVNEIPVDVNALKATGLNDIVRGETSERIQQSKFAPGLVNFLYQTGMSMADFAAMIPLDSLSGTSALSLAFMGTGAGIESVKEATERGLTARDAFETGLMAGIFEAMFEKISIEALLNPTVGEQTARYILKNMLAEGSEEICTSIANNIADRLHNGELSEYNQSVLTYMSQGYGRAEAEKLAKRDFAVQLSQDFLGGAVSGGVMASVTSQTTYYRAATLQNRLNDLQSQNAQMIEDMVSGREEFDLNRLSQNWAEQEQVVNQINELMGESSLEAGEEAEAEAETSEPAAEFDTIEELDAEIEYVGEQLFEVDPESEEAQGLQARYDELQEMRDNWKENNELPVRNSSERNDRQNPGGSVSSVESQTGRDAEIRRFISKAADKSLSGVEFAEAPETAVDLGIPDGDTRSKVYRVTGNLSQPLQDTVKAFTDRGFKAENVILFAGGELTRTITSGGIQVEDSIRGAVMPSEQKVFLRVDDPSDTAMQIGVHEITHDRIAAGEINVVDEISKIVSRIGAEKTRELIDKYASAFDGLDLGDIDVAEEIVCDAHAKINIFKNMSGEVSESMQQASEAVRETANETQTRGPPETKASRKASEAAIKKLLASNGVEIVDGSAIKASRASWDRSDKAKIIDGLVKAGFTKADAQAWVNDVNSIAAIIASDIDRLDYVSADNHSMLKPNKDYVTTLDASTLCAKRLLYQGTYNAIAHELQNRPLMAEDVIKLRNMMDKAGLEVPCGICYVESRRKALGKFASEWLETYKGNYIPSLDEVVSSDGLEELRKAHPDTYNDFIKAMNKKGTVNPKVVELRTEYDGEILKLTKGQIAKEIRIGGQRVQSFSDFETPHLIDMMQAVIDMAQVKLTSQAYTKVPNFAWVFGNTGIKINLSLIGDVDANGKLTFDNKEGMPFEEAMKLRDAYSENVGTILVGKNDKHILAAMADDRIDFIIPFHRSGWGKADYEALGLSGYEDYTNYQNEKMIDGSEFPGNLYPIDYWDYSKSGKENAEIYLKLCKEQGRKPKFSNFLVDNGDGSWSLQPDGSTDGYWKTLIDFKMYNNDGVGAPQRAVTPDFNMEQANRVLGEYKGGANSLPVADDIVKKFVEEYNKEHDIKASRSIDDNEQRIDDLEKRLSQLEGEYEFASGIKAKRIQNEMMKLQHDLDELNAEERKSAVQTPIQTILDNLDNYRRLDLISIGNQLTNSAWDELEDLDTEDIKKGIREIIAEREYSPLEMQVRSRGLYVRPAGTVSENSAGETSKQTTKSSVKRAVDSEGNQLSVKQEKYFAESKVRDRDGNLLLVHHGSPVKNITAFDKSRGGSHTGTYSDKDMIWFTDSEEFADDMSYEQKPGSSNLTYVRGEKGKVYSGYLNITRPLDLNRLTDTERDLLVDTYVYRNGGTEQAAEERLNRLLDIGNHQLIKFDYVDYYALLASGYDGVIARLDVNGKGDGLEYGAFYSEQFKDVNNTNPTSSEDIRYSRATEVEEKIKEISAKKRKSQADRIFLRDAGEKLSEKDFYALYNAHKIDLRRSGNVDEQVESIKRDGFKGDGGFGYNIMPATINNVSRYTEDERRAYLSPYMSEEEVEASIKDLRENPGRGEWYDDVYFPEINVMEGKYGGRVGDTVLLVPEHETVNGERVKNGFKPFDYEVVKVERAFQPYYELYSKAYDAAHAQGPGVRASRTVNENDDADEVSLLKQANRELLRQITELKKERAAMEMQARGAQRTITQQSANLMAKDWKDKLSSTMKQSEIAAKFKELGDWLKSGSKDISILEARKRSRAIAKELVDTAKVLRDDFDSQAYETIKGELKRPMTISAKDASSIADFNEWRKHHFGKINIRLGTEGYMVDQAYMQLNEMYPDYFPDDIANPADQLLRMADVYDSIQPVYDNPFDRNYDEALNYAETAILEDAIGLETYADKKDAEMDALKRKCAEQIQKVKEDRDKQIQAIKDAYKEKRAKQQESNERTRLLKIAKRLRNRKMPAVTRAKLDEYIGDLDLVAKSMTGITEAKLEELQEWYKKQQEDPDFIPNPTIEAKLERLHKRQINDLTALEVADLVDILLNIENELRTKDKFIKSEIAANTHAAGQQVIADIENTKGPGKADKVTTGMLTPEREARRVTGYRPNDPLYLAVRELSRGANRQVAYQNEAERQFTKWTHDKKFTKDFAGPKAKEISLEMIGMPNVKITPAMRASLWLHSLNPDNMRHIANGGVTIPDMKLYRQGKIQEAYDKGTTIKLKPSQVRAIASQMTGTEKAYASAASRYFNETSHNAINEVSEAKDGFSIANVDNYFPIDTNKAFLKSDFETLKKDGTIEGMGFTKQRVNASNPIMLYDMDTVLNKSISQHAKYVGLAIPVRNFNKLWNVGTWFEGTEPSGVQNSLIKVWGRNAYEYFQKMMTDLQNPSSQSDDIGKMLGKIRSRYAAAVLELNLSVAIKQAASYPTAAAVLGWGPLIKAMGNVGKVNLDTVYKYSPMQAYREKGFASQELGEITSRKGKTPALLNWIQGMDAETTRKLWKASEYYVREHFPNIKRGTDEYFRKVGEIHTQVLEETQPNYTVMQRPQFLRSDSDLTKTLMMFKTQPFQNFNILYDALQNYRAVHRAAKNGATDVNVKGARRALARAISSQAAASFVFALMQYAWDAFRRKDEKYREDGETTFKSWLKGMNINMLGNGFGMLPFGSEIFEQIEVGIDKLLQRFGADAYFDAKAYGLSDSIVEQINNTVNAVTRMSDALMTIGTEDWDAKAALDTARDSALTIAQYAGIPAKNVKNLYQAAKDQIDAVVQGQDPNSFQSKQTTATRYIHKLPEWKELDDKQQTKLDREITKWAQDTGSNEAAKYVVKNEKVPEGLRDTAAGKIIDGKDNPGVSAEEFFSFRVALFLADRPTKSGETGTFDQAETMYALQKAKLTDRERRYIWSYYYKSDYNEYLKSDKYKEWLKKSQ